MQMMMMRTSVVSWCVLDRAINMHQQVLIIVQSVIKASSNKTKKDKKKNKRVAADDAQDEAVPQDELEVDPSISKKPVEVTAEDLADEEWGPVKGKKGKKGKGKKDKTGQDDEVEGAEALEGRST